MDQPNYHVLLEGRRVGPYDRRTIVGMRIKHALGSDDLLVSSEGAQLTVRELIGDGPPGRFQPDRTGGYSRVQASFPASFLEVDGPGLPIPRFRGEVEARLHTEVLRLAGRYRRMFGWKEDRIKIALKDIVHARSQGKRIELWVRSGDTGPLQRIALELLSSEAAAELLESLPSAAPFPDQPAEAKPLRASAPASAAQTLWVAATGASLVIGVMLLLLIYRRLY